jgi:hypothetical protein
MAGSMGMKPDAMDMHKKAGTTMRKDKGTMGDQK